MAKDIKLLCTTEQTVLADYFVICTATSSTHVKTLTDEVDKRPLRAGRGLPIGTGEGGDFGCVIVHIFQKEMREFYNLEHLWSDAGR